MTMQRLVETAQGTSAGMTESMTENIGLVNARALRNGKSKKKKKKSVNKSNLGSPDHDASAALNDDDDHPVESVHSHAQELSPRQQFDDMPNAPSTSNKRKKKKKKSKSSAMESIDNQVTHSQPSTLHSHNLTLQYKSDIDSRTKFSGDNIWSSNNNSEERQRIREFWLQLGEDERRSLVKVEKEAVLKKMKEQQKHSCNCSVCGKKRTAIEEELEILYDAYYEELEQYANHQQSNHGYGVARSLQDGYASMRTDAALVDAYANQILASKNPLDHQDDYDDEDDDDEDDEEDDDEDDEDDEDYDGDYDDEDLSSRHDEHMMGNGDHFNFGNSLTVKGGILTVADDLLKNDGKKFLDMMERLAERRMQREEEAGLDQDEYYDDDDEDDDAYEDEVDEDTMTEEQRMEEGRRMFQIFAARMFEQRVLTAYREKIAQERQQRLLEELEEEDRQKEEREQKKLREKEKKKDKKRQLKKQKEEERMAKEAQRLAEEEKARIEKERKLEEERHKREQERLKKDEERRQREEERLRKEEEKRRRMKEEKDRLMEKERKRKEKEEKERKEREEKERKEAEELMRKEAEQKEQERLKMKERQEQNRKNSSTIPSSIPPSQPLSNLIPTASQSTPSNHSSMPYAIKSGSILKSPKALYSDVDESSPSLDTTLSLTPLAISNHAPQPLSFHHPLPSSPLSPVRSPSFRNHLPTSSLPVNTVFQDQEIEKSSTGVNSLANHTMGVLPVGYPKRMSSQLETAPVKSIARPNIAPIGKPPGYRRKSASTGIVGGPTIGAERRAQPPFETMVGTEPPFTEALQVDSSTQDAVNESHSSPSFFSLFGDSKGSDAASSLLNGVADSPRQRSVPQRPWLMHSPQRSQSISGEGGNSAWPNISGWGTPSNLIEETVQSKLFGDVMPDRLQLIVDRAKAAYLKLEELYTPTGHFPLNHWPVGMTFHPLFQLHRMYSDLFPDIVIDQQELLEACLTTNSGFNCINHPHQGYLLRYEMGDYNRRASLGVNGFLPSGPLSPSLSGSTMNDINFHQFTSHASPTGAQHHPPIPQQPHFHPLPSLQSQQPQTHQQQQSQQQHGQGNAALFGGLSL